MHKLLLIFLSLFSFNIYVVADEVQDPFEEINQVTFAVNEALDNAIAKPDSNSIRGHNSSFYTE